MNDEQQIQIINLIDKLQKQIENLPTFHDDILSSSKLHFMDEKIDRILEFLESKEIE